MTTYSSVSISILAPIPFNSKSTQFKRDESTTAKKWSILNKDSVQVQEETSTQSQAQSKSSSCKQQCQFCSHFQHELTHWGHCDALSALVPGQAPACILHEPCFGGQKAAVPLAQLQRANRHEQSLKALKSQAYYQYPSIKGY